MATAHSPIETPASTSHGFRAWPNDKKASLTEVACLVFCIEVIMWISPFTASPRTTSAGMILIIIVLLIVTFIRDRRPARELGLRTDNFFAALAHLILPLSVFILVVVVIGLFAGTLRFGPRFFSMLVFVPTWALLQQYLLLAFVNSRMRVIFGEGKRSRTATAAIFSILHLPNPVLTVACAMGGYIWASEHEREPNLFASALTHTLASAFLANTLPGWLLKNMVVGYNYFLR
jgi:small-conductance mechanosensitive channel